LGQPRRYYCNGPTNSIKARKSKLSKWSVADVIQDHPGRVEGLVDDFGLQTAHDPVGDGDCQFSTISDQLQRFHVLTRTPSSLRREAVEYLSETQSFDQLSSVAWDRFLTELRGLFGKNESFGYYGEQNLH